MKKEELLNRIIDIESEAVDRIWYDRSNIGTDFEDPNVPEDIRARALNELDRIASTYDVSNCDDFYHAYWSGVLAAIRYILDQYYDKDYTIEDLRNPSGTGLLDT